MAEEKQNFNSLLTSNFTNHTLTPLSPSLKIHTYIHMFSHTHTRTPPHTTHTHPHLHTHTHPSTHTHTHTHVLTHTHVPNKRQTPKALKSSPFTDRLMHAVCD